VFRAGSSEGGVGSSEIQRAGGIECGDARVDYGINTTYINAESVCALLRKIAAASVGLPITLVMDNARYQRCALVQDLAKAVGDRVAVSAIVLAEFESDRALVEIVKRKP